MTAPDFSQAGIYSQRDELLACRHWSKDLKLFARRNAASILAGNTASRFRGRGMDFDEARPYQAGDDIRSIDWRVTARTGTTHTKIYREERERPVLIFVDQRSSMFFGSQKKLKSVAACELAAALAWAALSRGDRIGGLVFGDESHSDIRPKRSRHTVLKLIHNLITYNQRLENPALSSQTKLATIIEDAQRIARPGSAVFIISDFHDCDEDLNKALFNLSRHCDVSLCQVSDPLEKTLPKAGNYTISNGLQKITLDTGKHALRQQYELQSSTQQQRLQKAANQAKTPLLDFSTTDSLPHKLNMLFNRGKK